MQLIGPRTTSIDGRGTLGGESHLEESVLSMSGSVAKGLNLGERARGRSEHQRRRTANSAAMPNRNAKEPWTVSRSMVSSGTTSLAGAAFLVVVVVAAAVVVEVLLWLGTAVAGVVVEFGAVIVVVVRWV